MKKVNKTDICELIAGAMDSAQLQALCDSLQEMENSVSDPDKKCEQVIALLKAGYVSWTGEEL